MEQEGIIRLSIFFGLFFVFAATEYIFPRRMVTKSKARRWITNWSVSFLNVLTLRLFSFALPLLAIGAAFDAQNLGIGLFNRIEFPFWIELILVILLLDFFIWLQHLLTHKIGFLWRIHRVHHSDTEMIGNMGWSIIGLTLIIKAVLFPLAYKSYASMAKMKELQPEMEKIKERPKQLA